MMKKIILLFILLINIWFTRFIINAQSFYDIIDENIEDKTFEYIDKEIGKYLEKYGTEKDYKFYNRWKNYYTPLVNEEGYIINNGISGLKQTMADREMGLKSAQVSAGILEGWLPLGPNSYANAGGWQP